jgi:RNA-directed DNA polymerase
VEKSAEAKGPAGIGIAGKDEREAERQDVRASGRRSDRSQPFGSLGGRVKGEAQRRRPGAQQGPATARHRRSPAEASLWERFPAREDLVDALRGVGQNAGAAGIDGVSTEQLRAVVERPLATAPLRARGGHLPAAARQEVTIPKPSGGQRTLGVPAAVDRLICQAFSQVPTPVFDPHFHPHSFGFRPGRSAHGAVERARQCIGDGAASWVDFDPD